MKRLALIALTLPLFAALLMPEAGIANPPLAADKILVDKSERKLMLLNEGEVVRTYPIALGRNPEGHKQVRGDGRTPEGLYVIDRRDPDSYFHKSLHISYPNMFDVQNARKTGQQAGGSILIHGTPPGFGPFAPDEPMIDWTDGCIAVTNEALDEIWTAVPDGTIIDIRP
jgi:murein L,D-transpeptidase YafK